MSQQMVEISQSSVDSGSIFTLGQLPGKQQPQNQALAPHQLLTPDILPMEFEDSTSELLPEFLEIDLPLCHSNSTSNDSEESEMSLASLSAPSTIVTFTRSHRTRNYQMLEPEQDSKRGTSVDQHEPLDIASFSTLFSPPTTAPSKESLLETPDTMNLPLPFFSPSAPSSPEAFPFSLPDVPERDSAPSPFHLPEPGQDSGVMDLDMGLLARRRDILDDTMMEEDSHLSWLARCFISELSVELLSVIFLEACQLDCLTNPGRSASALSIGLVSRLWRDVILTLQTAWASFSLVIRATDSPFMDEITPLLALYLARSGKTPLSFVAYFGNSACEPLLNALFDHSARWENVAIALSPSLFEPKNNRDFPILTTLDFSLTERCPIVLPVDGVWYLGHAKSLHTLTISSPIFYWPVDIGQPPIVNFATTRIPLSLAKSYLDRLPPSVRTFTYTSSFYELLPVALPHVALRSVRFNGSRGIGQDALSTFFSALNLPSATSIAINFPCWRFGGGGEPWRKYAVSWPHQEFISFIQRSACTLHELILSNVDLTVMQLGLCLEALPTLQNLELDEPPLFSSGVLVNALTQESYPALRAILPMLTRLKWRGRLSFSDDDFVKMVESRVTSDTSLMCVDVTFRLRRMQASAKSRLLALTAGGLKVFMKFE